MKNELRKPTFFQLILGFIFTNLKINYKYLSYMAPAKIGKYKLLHEIEKESGSKGFTVGIYRQGEKKVFIKTWYGVVRDLRYHALVTEYFSNKILNKKFSSKKFLYKEYRINVPKIIGYKLTKNSFSLIFEFVEGETLSTLVLKEQVEVFYSILSIFQAISRLLTLKEKRYFRNVSGKFYLFSLPFFTLLTLFSNPAKFKAILRAFIDCVKSVKSVTFEKLVLAHRDLEPHNIILNDSVLYIVDFERMAFTVPYYDINYLSLTPKFKALAEAIFKKLDLRSNEFLKNYIMIQFACIPDNSDFKNYYMQELQAKYA